ncbi:MAG: hypothetical protein ACHQYP_02950 [Nitrospiria bacterium]
MRFEDPYFVIAGKILSSDGNVLVNFFVNLLAAFYGLIGIFSIIPFLLLSFIFFLVEPSHVGRQVYLVLLLILGGTSFLGISIIYLVHRFNDLGRKIMIAYSLGILFLLLALIWRGGIGSRVLTSGNTIALGIIIFIFCGVTYFLFHPKVKQFFTG